MKKLLCTLVGFLFLAATQAPAVAGSITISEVLYDASGTDNGKVFVELYGPGGTALTGLWLEGVNGSDGSVTHTVDLGAYSLPSDGFFVIADATSSGTTSVLNADLLLGNIDLQNGPDAVRIMSSSGVVDALGYGTVSSSGVFAGEGSAAPDVSGGVSLARWFADVDTDDNSNDFTSLSSPTPGTGSLKVVPVPTPEPAGIVLFGLGLVALTALRRRYSRKQ